MWFLLSSIAALSNAGHSIGIKLLPRYTGLEIACLSHIVCGVIAFAFFFAFNLTIPTTADFIIPASATVVLNIIAVILLFIAISRSEISISLPFLSITPAITALLAYLMRGEVLSTLTVTGILMIIAGTFAIDSKSKIDFATFGGLRVFQDKGVQLVCIVALLFSLSSVYDKNASEASDPLTFSTISLIARGLFFAALTLWLAQRKTALTPQSKNEAWILLLIGTLLFLELLSQIYALLYIEVAPVIAVKRLSLVVTTLAGFLYFKETYTHGRLSGAIIMIIGSVVIYFG